MEPQQFFYSGQIRRFLIQFIRIMSGFQVEIAKNDLGIVSYQQVPVIYGDSSRQVAQIIRGNSENMLPTVPAMSINIASLSYDRSRILNPTHVSTIQLNERHYDPDTNEWTEDRGDSFTVERLMPVPYKLGLKLDIWTSNTEQKLQLIEQIATLFNPDIEIQNTDNFIDWTSLSAIFLNDVTWTSRNVPMGGDDSIDVASFTFELPIWLSTAAKVKKLGVIHKILTNIYDVTGQANSLAPGSLAPELIDLSNATLMTRTVITPGNMHILFLGNTIKLLKQNDIVFPDETVKLSTTTRPTTWGDLIGLSGKLTNGSTQIRLYQEGTDTEVIGTVAYHPTDDFLLLFSPINDTLPVNNLPAVNSIIDPFTVVVDNTILNPTVGYRFLILDDIGATTNTVGATAWRGSDNVDLIAKKNDIIEYNGDHWVVSFIAAEADEVKYVTSLANNVQYKFENNMWLKSVEGHYKAGTWRIVL